MRLGRTLPPAAALVPLVSVLHGLSGGMNGASEIRRFEVELKRYHAAEHVFLVSSGKASLYLILKALHRLRPEKDGVVIPAFNCYSVPSAIVRAGLRVRLCDIDSDTLDFDYPSLEKLVKSDKAGTILAILPTHLFGVPSDVPRVRRLVAGTSIKVVEDAAQALGVRVQGGRLGTLGDVGFFSLGRGKVFSTVEGGVVLTSDAEVAEAIKEELRLFKEYNAAEIFWLVVQAVVLSLFTDPRLFWIPKALPFLKLGKTRFDPGFSLKGMSGFQAGLSRGWQPALKRISAIRQANSAVWKEALRGWQGVFQPNVMAPPLSFLRYPVLIRNSDRRRAILKESELRGLGIMTAYPNSLDRLEGVIHQGAGERCANASSVARQLVTLPVHGYVTHLDRQKIKGVFFMSCRKTTR